jgi:putative membrane protein
MAMRHTKPIRVPALALAAATLLSGCSQPAERTASPQPSPAATAAPRVSDAEIAAIVVAANAIDVDAGRLALARSQNAEVRRFAQTMVTDHTAVNASAAALVGRLGVTPAESPISRSLKEGAQQTHARLSSLQGAAFDQAYLDNEIAYHDAVIKAVDGVLIPSATSAELRAALVGARPAFVAHLEHARHARAALSGSGQ